MPRFFKESLILQSKSDKEMHITLHDIMNKRLKLLLTLLLVAVLPSHAVLKEKDLEQTLSILRQDIANYYKQLQDEALNHKKYSEQVFKELLDISKRSNQNALMLYSQKEDYVFDLTYACNEVTTLYRDYNRSIQRNLC